MYYFSQHCNNETSSKPPGASPLTEEGRDDFAQTDESKASLRYG